MDLVSNSIFVIFFQPLFGWKLQLREKSTLKAALWHLCAIYSNHDPRRRHSDKGKRRIFRKTRSSLGALAEARRGLLRNLWVLLERIDSVPINQRKLSNLQILGNDVPRLFQIDRQQDKPTNNDKPLPKFPLKLCELTPST